MKMTTISNRALDTGEICRFCLSEDAKFVSIFKEDDLREEDEGVASRIMSITPVEVCSSSSSFICFICRY